MQEVKQSRGERQLVVFALGKESYGVEITSVREIINMQRITPLPEAPAFMEGVINLRGRVVPVIDLRKRLGLPVSEAGHETRIMVVEVGQTAVGCIVDAVWEVLTIAADTIEPAAGVEGIRAEYLEGIAKAGEQLVILVDLRRVVAGVELAAQQPGSFER